MPFIQLELYLQQQSEGLQLQVRFFQMFPLQGIFQFLHSNCFTWVLASDFFDLFYYTKKKSFFLFVLKMLLLYVIRLWMILSKCYFCNCWSIFCFLYSLYFCNSSISSFCLFPHHIKLACFNLIYFSLFYSIFYLLLSRNTFSYHPHPLLILLIHYDDSFCRIDSINR